MKRIVRDEVRSILAVALVSAAISPVAVAQQAGGPSLGAIALTEVVVTGSRIQRTEQQGQTVAITTVGAEQLLEQGNVNLGDALNDLPALRASFSQGNSTRFIGTAGVSWLDLRGLGTTRTLVLVNNRRHVTSDPSSSRVDVNTIPADLLERVDIVTGGNSSVYGSDAVAGVVNFITKRNFEGVSIRTQAGQSSDEDRETLFGSLAFGHNFADGRGNVAVALEYSESDPLYFHQRDSLTGAFSGRSQFNLAEVTTDDGPTNNDGIPDNLFFRRGVFNAAISDGGVVTNSATATTCATLAEPTRSQRCLPNGQPRIFSFDRNGNLVETVPDLDFRAFGSGNVRFLGNNVGELSSLRNTGQLAPGLERSSINILSHFEVSEHFRPFFEGKFVHIEALQEGQPSFFQGSGGTAGFSFSCSNPFLSAQALGVLQTLGRCATPSATFTMGRFNVDFGGRGEQHERQTYRFVLGADGVFNDDWRYEVALNYGRYEADQVSVNNLVVRDLAGNPDGWRLAVDAVRNASGQIVCRVNETTVTRPDCVPINVFGVGAPSQAALDFVNTNATRRQEADQMVASAFMSGDTSDWFELPAGPLAFATGVEYRKETAMAKWDDLTKSGATFLNAIADFVPPDLTVKDVFAEVRVPLFNDLPFMHELTIEGAGRMSEYNTATDRVSAYNAGIVYAPVADLRLRANVSTSVRAPTVGDLYSALSQNFAQIQDPCDVLFINNNPNRAANCAAAGIPVGFVNAPARASSTGFRSGGNPLLVEEQGDSFTLGAMFTPSAIPGLTIAVDYYKIEVKDLIATVAAQTILNECYSSNTGINNPFCATVSRQPDFTFTPVSSVNGQLQGGAVIAGGVNFARQQTEGVDIDVSYRRTLENGHKLSMRFIGTQVLELTNWTNPSNPQFANRQLSELGDPERTSNFNFGYTMDKLDLSYSVRYIGKQALGLYEEQHFFRTLPGPGTASAPQPQPPLNLDRFPFKYFPSQFNHSARVQYSFTDKIRGYVGVDNLTDELPPLGQLGTGDGDPFDPIGRYYYMGVKFDM